MSKQIKIALRVTEKQIHIADLCIDNWSLLKKLASKSGWKRTALYGASQQLRTGWPFLLPAGKGLCKSVTSALLQIRTRGWRLMLAKCTFLTPSYKSLFFKYSGEGFKYWRYPAGVIPSIWKEGDILNSHRIIFPVTNRTEYFVQSQR